MSPSGELLVGTSAKNQYVAEPENTVRSIKRKMGTEERVTLAGQEYTPQEISDQTVLWGDTVARIENRIDEIRAFLKRFMKKKHTVCILTGAGTSEFPDPRSFVAWLVEDWRRERAFEAQSGLPYSDANVREWANLQRLVG